MGKHCQLAFSFYLVPDLEIPDGIMELTLIGIIFGSLIALLIGTKSNPALLFVGAACLCMFLDFIEPEQLLLSYVNETLIALLLLLMISAAIERTAVIPMLSRRIFVPKRRGFSLLRLSSLALLLSSHLNNSASVASLMWIV